MKKVLWFLPVLLAGIWLAMPAKAIEQSAPYQIMRLTPGWNIVSTPRPVASHVFSTDDVDILLLDQSVTSSAGGWVTMADLGQTEFTPLYGYFINNKTDQDQTLTFYYKTGLTPNEKLLERKFTKTGWYSFAPAHTGSTAVTKQCTGLGGVSNVKNVLQSLENKFSLLVPFGFSESVPDLYSVGENLYALGWNDFDNHSLALRELQGYAMYVTDPNAFLEGVVSETEGLWGDACDKNLYVNLNNNSGNNPGGELSQKEFEPGSKKVHIASFKVEAAYNAYTIQSIKIKTSEKFPFKNLRVRLDNAYRFDGDLSVVNFEPIENPTTNTEYAFNNINTTVVGYVDPIYVDVYVDVNDDAELISDYSFIELSEVSGKSEATGAMMKTETLAGQKSSIVSLVATPFTTRIAIDTPVSESFEGPKLVKAARFSFTAPDNDDVYYIDELRFKLNVDASKIGLIKKATLNKIYNDQGQDPLTEVMPIEENGNYYLDFKFISNWPDFLFEPEATAHLDHYEDYWVFLDVSAPTEGQSVTTSISLVEYVIHSFRNGYVFTEKNEVGFSDENRTSNVMTVIAAGPSSSLTIFRDDTSTSTVAISEFDGAVVMGINFTAGSTDVRVDSLNLHGLVDADLDGIFYPSSENGVNLNHLVKSVGLWEDVVWIGGASIDDSGNAVLENDFIVPAGTTKAIILRADISSFTGANRAFAFNFTADDVQAESLGGHVIIPTINGINLNGDGVAAVDVFTKITNNSKITIRSNQFQESYLIAGIPSEQNVLSLQINTLHESFTVKKIVIKISEADSLDNIAYLRLFTSEMNSIDLSGPVFLNSDGLAIFDKLDLAVSDYKTLVVKALLNDIGKRDEASDSTSGDGADAGDEITFSLSADPDDFLAISFSGNSDTQADMTNGSSFRVVKSEPYFDSQPLSTSYLGNGEVSTIFKFYVTGNGNSPISIARITPNISFVDADNDGELKMVANSLKLYKAGWGTPLNTGDNQEPHDNTSVSSEYGINIDTDKYITIPKGDSEIFEIRAEFVGVEQGDMIKTHLVKDSSDLSGIVMVGPEAVADIYNKFVWSDNSADVQEYDSRMWLNSYRLDVPTDDSVIFNW